MGDTVRGAMAVVAAGLLGVTLAGCDLFESGDVEAGAADTVELPDPPDRAFPTISVQPVASVPDDGSPSSYVVADDETPYLVRASGPPVDPDVADQMFCFWLEDGVARIRRDVAGVRMSTAVSTLLSAAGQEPTDEIDPRVLAEGCGLPAGPPEVLYRLTDDLVAGEPVWYVDPPADYEGDPDWYDVDAFNERVGGELDELCDWVRSAAAEAIASGAVTAGTTEQAISAVHEVLVAADVPFGDGLTSMIAGFCEVEGRRSDHIAEVHERYKPTR